MFFITADLPDVEVFFLNVKAGLRCSKTLWTFHIFSHSPHLHASLLLLSFDIQYKQWMIERVG